MKNKIIDIGLPVYAIKNFEIIIRNQIHCIGVVLEAIRLILLQNDGLIQETDSNYSLQIRISRMNRLFFNSEHKKFSIAFPFRIINNNSTIEIFSNSGIQITNKIYSDLITLHLSKKEDSLGIELYEMVIDEKILNDSFIVFEELIYSESCYVRFDYDEKNFQAHKHPLYHFDINFSGNGTFKIGIYNQLSVDDFFEHLNTNTDSNYLSVYDKKLHLKK